MDEPLSGWRTEGWRAAALRLGGCWLALLLAFASDWQAMFGQWWNSSTYNHILLVPLILAWLVWQRLPELARLVPRVWLPGLVAAFAALMFWVLGAISGLDLLRQTGAVALLPASALVLLGPRVVVGLLFPFAYMAFLVPFGDELVPPLQTITAKLTITMVGLSGIPAAVNGVFIDTPAGLFEVAEACSGVKFLIAMIALGVLVSNVGFRSWKRRAAFMALCIVAPILANGVRAWGTIYLAQIIGAKRAGGIDHLIYGWIFFALVIAAVMAVSWRFFDRAAGEPMIEVERINASPLLQRLESGANRPVLAIAALALMTVGAAGWARAADSLVAPLPGHIDLPLVAGWHRIDYAPQAWWEPRAAGADHRLLGRYADGAGHQVDVFFALYSAQGDGREAGGFGQGALSPDSGWSWVGEGDTVPDARSERILAQGRVARSAVTFYRNGDLLTGSNTALKLAVIKDRLLLRRQATMMLILSAEQREGLAPSDKSLEIFRSAIGPVGPWMDQIGKVR